MVYIFFWARIYVKSYFFFFSSRRRHTRFDCDWSSDVCSSDLEKKGGMSYESAQDPRLHFGLGNRTQVDAVEVLWPSGGQTRVANIKADQIVTKNGRASCRGRE